MTEQQPVPWLNGRTLTTINLVVFILTAGISVGTILSHVRDHSIHEEPAQQMSMMEKRVDPVRSSLAGHIAMDSHPAMARRVEVLEGIFATHTIQADARYERILQELMELKAIAKSSN